MSPHNLKPSPGNRATLISILFLLLALTFSRYVRAAEQATEPTDEQKKESAEAKKEDAAAYDFEHEDAFMDVPDALRSKQFVHRAILSTIIRDTSKVALGSAYCNQAMGFNAIYSPANRGGKSFAKYVAGSIGLGLGYSSSGGHAIELAVDFSGVSTLMLGYRFFLKSEKVTFWPTFGFGAGTEVGIHLADVPIEAKVYQGMTSMGYFTLGAIVPLVDVAFRLDMRFNFFGLDRLMLTTTAGLIFFL